MDDVQLTLGAEPVAVRLLAEVGVDGEVLPLSQCEWVLWGRCGCPLGACIASYAPTEADAWREFFEYKREIAKAQRQGQHLELMSRERWSREVCDRMKVRCPHTQKAGTR